MSQAANLSRGQRVPYQNHVTGQTLGSLEIVCTSDRFITAKNAMGRIMQFTLDGKATWSCNLSLKLPT